MEGPLRSEGEKEGRKNDRARERMNEGGKGGRTREGKNDREIE